MKVKVAFYVEPGVAKDVLAVFQPDCARGALECYSRVGQHSTCSSDYLKGLRRATPGEYARLAKELRSIGYFLEIEGEKPGVPTAR